MGRGMSFHFQNQLMKFRLGSLILGIRVKKWCWQVSPAACWNLANCKGSCKTGCPKSLRKLLSNIIENNPLALSKTQLLIGKLQNAHSFDLSHGRHFSRHSFTMAPVARGVCMLPNFQIGHFHQRNSRIAVSAEDDTSILTALPNPGSIPSAPGHKAPSGAAPAALCRQLRAGTSSRKDYGLDLYRPAHSSYPLPKLNPLFKLLKSTEGWLWGTIHTALCNVHTLIDGNRYCLSPFRVALL